jgi:general secretion pathway protein A
MYLSFYGFRQEPFNITPDPEFLFLSPSHKEAFAAVMYGVDKRKGFVALTGEVGTGKTTILRAYLKQVEGSAVHPIYLFTSDLSFEDLLMILLRETGAQEKPRTPRQMLLRLHWNLIGEYRQNRNTVLIIDEAQNMPVETLEKLRVLSNLETTKEKLLQVVLVGQPELDRKLALHELRQLHQRIAIRSTIQPLTEAESLTYIEHRVNRAGGNLNNVFSPAALRAIVKYAKGIPRSLNILCDNVLITGYGYQKRPISAKIVREIAWDLKVRPYRPRLRWLSAVVVLLMTVLGVLSAVSLGYRGRRAPESGEVPGIVHAGAVVLHTVPQPASADTFPTARPVDGTSAVLDPGGPAAPAVPETSSSLAPTDVAPPAPQALAEQKASPGPDRPAREPAPEAPTPEPAAVTDREPEMEAPKPDRGRAKTSGLGAARVVKKGDNLSALVADVYGHSDDVLIEFVKGHNPNITNVNLIMVGQTVVFPELDESRKARAVTMAAGGVGSS